MPVVPIIAVVGAATGATAAVGAGIASAIGLGTVGTVAATAIGSAALAGVATAVQGGDAGDVLKSAVLGGATSFVGGTIGEAVFGSAGSGVSQAALDAANATADPIAAINAIQGWTTSDVAYLASIGASQAIIDAAVANNAALTGGTATPTEIPESAIAEANLTDDPIAALNASQGWTVSDVGYMYDIGATKSLIDAAIANNLALGVAPTTMDLGIQQWAGLDPSTQEALLNAGVDPTQSQSTFGRFQYRLPDGTYMDQNAVLINETLYNNLKQTQSGLGGDIDYAKIREYSNLGFTDDQILNAVKNYPSSYWETALNYSLPTQTLPDGTIIETSVNGRTVRISPDGTTVTTQPDGSVLTNNPDGSSVNRFPDGRITVVDSAGQRTEYNPDGGFVRNTPERIILRTADELGFNTPSGPPSGVTVNPDGSTTMVFDDGTSLTYYPDGTVTSASPIEGGTVALPPAGPTTVVNPDGSTTQTFNDGSTMTTLPNGDVTFTEGTDVVSPVTTLPPVGPTTVVNPDGSTTQTFDDGSTMTTSPTGEVTSTPGTDVAEIVTTLPPVGPTTVMNPDGSTTQTFDDGSTLTTSPTGEVTSTPGTDVVMPVTTPSTGSGSGSPNTQIFDDGSTLTTNPDGSLISTPATNLPTAGDLGAATWSAELLNSLGLGGLSSTQILGLMAAGALAPAALQALGVIDEPATATGPNYGDKIISKLPKLTDKPLTLPGLNPGLMPVERYYETTRPEQPQYYWGVRPYVQGQADLAKMRQEGIPGAPEKPFGFDVNVPRSFDVNEFIRQTINPQQSQAIAGAGGNYQVYTGQPAATAPTITAPVVPTTPVVNAPVTAVNPTDVIRFANPELVDPTSPLFVGPIQPTTVGG